MIQRIASLLRIGTPATKPAGLLIASGTAVPTGAGYQKGCIFQNTATGKLYVNGGNNKTADFKLVTSA